MNPLPELDVTITTKSRWGRPILRLNRPVRWSRDRNKYYDRHKERVVVGEEYETDLASIPFFIWPILSPWGPWRRAAIIHDYLCDIAKTDEDRLLADALFRVIMREDGVKWFPRAVIYYAVRGAWLVWGRWRA